MSFEFTVSDVIPATPAQVYAAWLDGAGHTGNDRRQARRGGRRRRRPVHTRMTVTSPVR